MTVILMRLAVTYYRPDFSAAQAKLMIADYVEDLLEFGVSDVDEAVKMYRRRPESEFFPKPGVLRQLAGDARKDRQYRETPQAAGPSKGPEFGGRPQMWWGKAKRLWPAAWRESEVPEGEKIRDVPGGRLREPSREFQ